MNLYQRQYKLFNPEENERIRIDVIGAGSMGSFASLAIAKMGLKKITVYDFDKVEQVNIPNQFYRLSDVGAAKVDALKDIISQYTGTNIVAECGKFQERYKPKATDITIVTVDSLDQRKEIWGLIKHHTRWVIDARAAGEFIVIYALQPELDSFRYESTLRPSSEAYRAPCGAQSIIYTVIGTASVIALYTKRILFGLHVPFETMLDFALLNGCKDGRFAFLPTDNEKTEQKGDNHEE